MAAKITGGSKAVLRAEILAARTALPAATRRELSVRIGARMLELDAWRNAEQVLLYLSFGSEFETVQLVNAALANGKRLCLPRIRRETNAVEIHRVRDPARETVAGAFGIYEPRAECARVDIGEIDFVLVPGVAFTPRCERLGYGGGYYDRLIAGLRARPPLIAAAFALQIREQLPLTASDQRIDRVVTETASYCAC